MNTLVQRLLRDWFRLSGSRGGDVDNFLAKETWDFHLPLHTGSTTDWDLLAPSRVFGLIWSQDSGLRLCYGLDSASLYLRISLLKYQLSIPQSVTMLRDKVFEEVIKLKRDC